MTKQELAAAEKRLAAAAQTYRQPKRSWTPREEDLLRRYYGRVSVYDLCKVLDRTAAGVNSQAYRLRITKSQMMREAN